MRLRSCICALTFLTLLATGVLLALPVAPASSAQPLDGVFTYQGRLTQDGEPANGIFNLEFRLYDALSGGSQQGVTDTHLGEEVIDGMVTLQLDFQTTFGNMALWLQISVNGQPLTPRQPLTPSPIALFALDSDAPPSGPAAGDLTGTYPNPSIAGNTIGADELQSDPASLSQVTGGLVEIIDENRIEFTDPGRLEITNPDNSSALIIRRIGADEIGSLRMRGSTLDIRSTGFIRLSSITNHVDCRDPSGTWQEVHAGAFVQMSSRSLKQDIRALDEQDLGEALNTLRKLDPVTYRYNWDAPDASPHLGFIAEDLPAQVRDESGKAVDLYALITTVVAATQQLDEQKSAEIDALRARIAELESVLSPQHREKEGE